jgi:hypothetical protein
MKRMLLIICLPLLIACKREPGQGAVTENREQNKSVAGNQDSTLTIEERIKKENIRIEFDRPIAFASTNNIAIPLIFGQKYLDKGLVENEYYNILVLTPEKPEGELVFEKSSLIRKIVTLETRAEIDVGNDYYDSEEKVYSKEFNSLLFIEKVSPDSVNGGEVLLYVYDLQQMKLFQLSPDHYDLVSWYPVDGKSTVIVSCMTDNYRDGHYDWRDDVKIFMTDIKSGVISEKKFDEDKLKRMQYGVKRNSSDRNQKH